MSRQTMIPNNPREMGVPHDTWRENQVDILNRINTTDDEYVFAELAVGSGKSSVATALGAHDGVTVCVHTLALLTQYEQKYGFSVVRGRQEYPCVHEQKVRDWKTFKLTPLASDCTYKRMTQCPYVDACPYFLAKTKARVARRSACTYRYMALSENMKEREGYLIFDEAHDSAEELIRFNQAEIPHKVIRHYHLPTFPLSEFGEGNKGDVIDVQTRNTIAKWVRRCREQLVVRKGDDSPQASRIKKMRRRLSHLSEIATLDSFLNVTDTHVRVLSLSADRVADEIFKYKRRKVLMSGTIGEPQPLADALGIVDFDAHSFPHPIPANKRTVDNLNMPRMVKRVLDVYPENYQLQVEKTWDWIQLFPPEWRGAILSTSYKKIEILHEGLKRLNNGRRLIVQQVGNKVNDVVQKFVTDVRDGDIMVGTVQGMGTGIDLHGDLARWLVIAGTPHVNPTDRYMRARREIEGGIRYQRWLTYNAVAQASGRVTRGATNGNGEYIHNYVAIADGSALTKTAMSFYPQWFKEAIQ